MLSSVSVHNLLITAATIVRTFEQIRNRVLHIRRPPTLEAIDFSTLELNGGLFNDRWKKYTLNIVRCVFNSDRFL